MHINIKLNNGVVFELINARGSYLKKIYDEFYCREIYPSENASFSIRFVDTLEIDHDSFVQAVGPVAADRFGVFFLDQKDKIARFQGADPNTGKLIFEFDSRFDPHFFYIVILYCVSIVFSLGSGVFVHAACLKKDEDYILLPAWRHVGKTHLALSMMADGYELVTDDGLWLDRSGVFYPVSRNIHILYHNLKINPDLNRLIDPSEMRPYHLISKLEKGDLLISNEHLRYLRSQFRVRVPIEEIWGRNEFKLTKGSSLIFLNRNIHDDGISCRPMANISEVVSMIASSSKFEISFMLDLYDIYKSRFGLKISCFENYDRRYIKYLSEGLSPVEKMYKYSFFNYPNISDIVL